MAIKALTWMVRVFEPPIYCFHEIVHNRWVVKAFEDVGVIFINDIAEAPAGSPIMLSAHGSAPEVVAEAEAHAGIVVDAVCPLVTKVHHEVRRMADQGFEIIYVGHQGHDEAVGTIAEAPGAITLVEPEIGLGDFSPVDPAKVALLAQTTLGVHEWQSVLDEARQSLPQISTARKSDLCYATTNRQEAVRSLTKEADLILVVGSESSSNTRALVRVAREAGIAAHRIDDAASIEDAWLDQAKVVGVTAGASAPDHLVQEVIDRVDPAEGVRLLQVTEEGEYFPLPPQLRGLLKALQRTVEAGFGARPASDPGPLDQDPDWDATEALAAISR